MDDIEVHKALKSVIEIPTRRYLWVPEDEIEFVPALCDKVFGDGRALFGLTTIHSRPRFYVVRGDSRWILTGDAGDGPDFVEFYDDILWALEEQFGDGRPRDFLDRCEDCPLDSEDDGSCDCEQWPALDVRDGCSWWREKWPATFKTEPHPLSRSANLLKEKTDG